MRESIWGRLTVVSGCLSLMASSAQGLPIINLGGENYTVGMTLPDPNPFCTTSCGGEEYAKGRAEQRSSCDPGTSAPTGNTCFRWDLAQATPSIGNEIQCNGRCNVATQEGDVLYLSFQMNLQNPNGDIFHDGPNANSADKGLELRTPSRTGGYRWALSMGCWDSNTVCLDHHFTVWVGNPDYHFNRGGTCGEVNDIYRPNSAPYVGGNVPQLAYNRWHNVIMGITMSSGTSGRVEAWVNGRKFLDCGSIKTMNTSDNTFSYVEFGGTIAQPAYDAPAHIRYFDNFIVSKAWADVSAFLTDPEGIKPATPSNLKVQ